MIFQKFASTLLAGLNNDPLIIGQTLQNYAPSCRNSEFWERIDLSFEKKGIEFSEFFELFLKNVRKTSLSYICILD